MTTSIDGWRWYEDEYFNIKFQYPPDWKVEKVDLTNYVRSEEFPGHDTVKYWELRVIPPWDDKIEGVYQRNGTEDSGINILQPGIEASLGNYGHRPKEFKYEEILDHFDGGLSFNIEQRVVYLADGLVTRVSVGKSQDQKIAGITATKHFSRHQQDSGQNFLFHSFMLTHTSLKRSEEAGLVFGGVMQTMQLLHPDKVFQWVDYKIPVDPSEYIYP